MSQNLYQKWDSYQDLEDCQESWYASQEWIIIFPFNAIVSSAKANY